MKLGEFKSDPKYFVNTSGNPKKPQKIIITVGKLFN